MDIASPVGFSHQVRIEGINPVSRVNTMFGYIFWNRDQAVISFTGTQWISEWIADLWFVQIAPDKLNGYMDGVMIHRGFYEIYMSIRDKLWSWWNENCGWVKTLFITGHSLGGALSTICAYDFAEMGIKCSIVHYSFAAPRSGNIAYTQVFKERLPTSLRINNTEDIVPQLPFACFAGYIYKHTHGNIPFTISLQTIGENHTIAYHDSLPDR